MVGYAFFALTSFQMNFVQANSICVGIIPSLKMHNYTRRIYLLDMCK